MSKRIFFSVGEPSGDLHAANLIRSMKQISDETQCRGFGGIKMMQAGLECDFDLTQMAVMGFTEVLPKLREFFSIADQASAIFATGEVDAVVLVDFPGFNWHIAKRAKEFGIPVYYYLPPQLWAWGGWRVHKLRRNVDRVFCNLPFEEEWFQKHDVPVDFVGHPFFDEVASKTLDSRFIHRWSKADRLQVAVLPGSRDREVRHIWPMQLEAIRRLNREFPQVEFLVATLKDAHALSCRQAMSEQDQSLPIEIFVGKTSEIIEMSDCALMKSGSVSLEVLARSTPAVVVYHVGLMSYSIGRWLVNVESFSLPNLIAREKVMPEFLSVGKSPKVLNEIVDAMRKMIGDAEYRQESRDRLRALADRVAQPGASDRTAARILELVEAKTGNRTRAA